MLIIDANYVTAVTSITKWWSWWVMLTSVCRWVHMPFFGDTVRGSYVRIGIGAHEGRMVYRVSSSTSHSFWQDYYHYDWLCRCVRSQECRKLQRSIHWGQLRPIKALGWGEFRGLHWHALLGQIHIQCYVWRRCNVANRNSCYFRFANISYKKCNSFVCWRLRSICSHIKLLIVRNIHFKIFSSTCAMKIF